MMMIAALEVSWDLQALNDDVSLDRAVIFLGASTSFPESEELLDRNISYVCTYMIKVTT